MGSGSDAGEGGGSVLEGVRTGWKVAAIQQDRSGVTIRSGNGKPPLRAKYVIVTVSIGVLKAGLITFSPPLSLGKQGAIYRSAMGVYDKVLLKFPELPAVLQGKLGVIDTTAI